MVDSCPAGIEYGWEAYWNAGKIWIARSILNGDLEFSEEVRDVIMPCITCGQCSSQCENKIPTVDVIEALRADYLSELSLGAVKQLYDGGA